MVTKKLVNFNKETKELTWEIGVNNINISVKNAKIIENISDEQAFVNNSVTVISHGETNTPIPTVLEITPGKQYEIKLGDLTKRCVIQLKTKITDDSMSFKNAKITPDNNCTLQGDNIVVNHYTAQASKELDTTMLTKDGVYDYNNKTFTWTIIVNESQTPIKWWKIWDI